MRTLILLSLIALVQGCTIRQDIKPVNDASITQLTIIENPDVKLTYLKGLREDIEAKGIQTDLAPARTPPEEYAYALTYTANWAWDLALYMVYTKIDVYKEGAPIGNALYDARMGVPTWGGSSTLKIKSMNSWESFFPTPRKINSVSR